MPALQVGPTKAAAADRLLSATRGLDFLNLWVATIQTGFGPFVAVYLTSRGWTQTNIGLALSLGTLTAMISQIPAGALVDALKHKGYVAAFSILAFAASALLFALLPTPLSIYVAEILHGFSSCTLGPAITAISLALAGQAALGERLGRNARFASVGNGVGAALILGLLGIMAGQAGSRPAPGAPGGRGRAAVPPGAARPPGASGPGAHGHTGLAEQPGRAAAAPVCGAHLP